MNSFDSVIVPMEERSSLLALLRKGHFEPTGLTLLYRASRDGDESRIFHQKCDNMGPTATVVLSNYNKIFGGVANKSWMKDCMIIEDEKYFVFSLDLEEIYKPPGSKQIIMSFEKFGPVFRCHDLHIDNFAIQTRRNIWKMDPEITGRQFQEITGETFPKFELQDYEVFKMEGIENTDREIQRKENGFEEEKQDEKMKELKEKMEELESKKRELEERCRKVERENE